MNDLGTVDPHGLTTVEAGLRLAADGPNALEDERSHVLKRALGTLWAPVPWLLEAAIILQVALGEYPEAVVVAVLLLFNAGLSFFQERGAQATLDGLKDRLAPVASVLRDGVWATLPAPDLVRGDLVTLSLGAIVPADTKLVTGSILLDQSMLTGESAPVEAGAGDDAPAGALVRRGEATAEVIATGSRTKSGRGAELIRTAHVEGTEQKAIFRVVRNLALFNGGVTVALVCYAIVLHLSFGEIAPLAVVSMLASIPVALPSMFTLAATVGARSLARRGVLPTRLSALDEAAGVDLLCADKTGTLTVNSLAVGECRGAPGFSLPTVLAIAAIASSAAGADPIDAAVRQAATVADGHADFVQTSFEPFDPDRKLSLATATAVDGSTVTVIKGAYASVAARSQPSDGLADVAHKMEAAGERVLAVAVGAAEPLQIVGVIGLTDPPRPEARGLVEKLTSSGVRTVMVTGDAPATAKTVAEAVGIEGGIASPAALPSDADLNGIGVFAGVLPEDKFALVKRYQSLGHVVAVCGDGVNDAPALSQAQMGVAVSTATDVAKSAAGIVLTEAGLGGVLAAITEGRATFQRILTYTLRSLIHKVVQVLFLLGGLLITGHAIITPVLMVLMMVAGDFLAMSSSTDHVRGSTKPNVWRIGNLTLASVILGLCDLAFCLASLLVGRFGLGLDIDSLQTLAVVTLVFSGQAVFYIARERRHLWSSRPSRWVVLSSVADIGLIVVLAAVGILMTPLPIAVIAVIAVAAVGLAFVLDGMKVLLFRRLAIA